MAVSSDGRSFCPHCEESLAHRTYREHVRMFCDPVTHIWTKKRKTAAGCGDPREREESEVSVETKRFEPTEKVLTFHVGIKCGSTRATRGSSSF